MALVVQEAATEEAAVVSSLGQQVLRNALHEGAQQLRVLVVCCVFCVGVGCFVWVVCFVWVFCVWGGAVGCLMCS